MWRGPKPQFMEIFRSSMHAKDMTLVNMLIYLKKDFDLSNSCMNQQLNRVINNWKVKSVRIWSFFWYVFYRIRNEYEEIPGVQMRENTDQKNSEYLHFSRIVHDLLEIKSSSDLLYAYKEDFRTISLSRRQNISKISFLKIRNHHKNVFR